MPLFRWTLEDLPIRWKSKKQLRADYQVLTKHYKDLRGMYTEKVCELEDCQDLLDNWRSYAQDQEAYNAAVVADHQQEVANETERAEHNLAAFRDVCLQEEMLRAKIELLKIACDDADYRAMSLGRHGRVGTRAIRKIIG